MEIKTDALFKKEIKKSIEYALQEFGLKTARKWQTQYKEIKRLLEFMPKRYPIVAHFRNETMEKVSWCHHHEELQDYLFL